MNSDKTESVRIPHTTMRRVRELAKKNRRMLTAQVDMLLLDGLSRSLVEELGA